jgi:glycosyltransferase involved in cell wall biosynthesis
MCSPPVSDEGLVWQQIFSAWANLQRCPKSDSAVALAVAIPTLSYSAMRILFTNNTLDARAGTELYVYDVARELRRLGHQVVAYSPRLGEVSKLLWQSGVRTIPNLAELPFRPDVIHGHHHIETMTALASLPGVPAIFVCHGTAPWEEMPPVFPRILRYAAVSVVCRARVVRDAAIPAERVRVMLNFADTDIFRPRPPLPVRPARALVFSNYATRDNYAAAVRAGCEQAGVALDVRGFANGNPALEPQHVLPQYDIVFAKGRAAIEALAVGCAVILCDTAGLGPMVSRGNFPEVRPVNFGLAALRDPHTAEGVAAAVRAYDAADATVVRDLIRSQADMRDSVAELVRLYAEVIAENSQLTHDPLAELRAAGAYLQTLDSILKHEPGMTPIIAPPVTVPDAIALPRRKKSWLRRLIGK